MLQFEMDQAVSTDRLEAEEHYMRRKPHIVSAVIATLLALLIVGSVSVTKMTTTALSIFIVPGATNIQIQSSSIWEQHITYQTSEPNYGWYVTVVRNLGMEGWSAPIDNRVRLQSSPAVHWRIWPLWFVYIKERAALQGNPNAARITVEREIIIPWRQHPWPLVDRLALWLPSQNGIGKP